MNKTPAELDAIVQRIAGTGIERAAPFLEARIKEKVSVPAPRERRTTGPRSRSPGRVYYVATSPAQPGAPPRKLSGRMRSGVAHQIVEPKRKARVGGNVEYMRRHEMGNHPFLVPTLLENMTRIAAIIGAD